MNAIIIYMLKVAAALAMLTIPYYLFLRKDAQLVLKRFYLLGGLVVSWLFPLITMSKPEITGAFAPAYFIDPGSPVMVPTGIEELVQSASSAWLNWTVVIAALYIGGMLGLLMKNVASYRAMKSKSIRESKKHDDVVLTSEGQVLTLFHTIFIPVKYNEDAELDSILIHERAHIRQLHIIDVLLAELTLLLTWFNPFSWLISRMIKENHEHLADRSVLQQGVHPARYKALLLNHAMGGQVIRVGHQFNHSLTKNRFNMMKKMKAQRKGYLKYVFMVPVVLLFTLLATASSQAANKTIKAKVLLESKDVPATGASVIVAGTTMGTVVDRNGNFRLEVNGNPEIAISFVGYKTLMLTAEEIEKQDLIMHPESFNIDFPQMEKNTGTKGAGFSAESGNKNTGNKIEKPVPDQKEIFYIVEDVPSFPGGMDALKNYLSDNMVYQKENGKYLTGTVLVNFSVLTDGSIDDIKIVNSSSEALEKPAIKLIKDMPDWNPGKQRGKPVRTSVNLPVRYLNPPK